MAETKSNGDRVRPRTRFSPEAEVVQVASADQAAISRGAAPSAAPLKPQQSRMSGKVKVAIGAAGLFLFLVGVKRTFRTEEGVEIDQEDADRLGEEEKKAREGAA